MSQNSSEPTFICIKTQLTRDYERDFVEIMTGKEVEPDFAGDIVDGAITYKFQYGLEIRIACTEPQGRVDYDLFGNFVGKAYAAFQGMGVKQYVSTSRMDGIFKGAPLNTPVLWMSINDFSHSLQSDSVDLTFASTSTYGEFMRLFYAPIKSRGIVGIRLTSVVGTRWEFDGDIDIEGEEDEEDEDAIIEDEEQDRPKRSATVHNEPTFIRINTLLTQEYGRKLVEYLIDEPIAKNFVGSIEKGDITYKFTPHLVIHIACTGPEGRVNCNLFGNFLCTVYRAFRVMGVKQYVNSSHPMVGIRKGVPLNSPVLWVSIDDFVRSLKSCSVDLGADYVDFRNLFYAPVKSRGAVGIRLSNIIATEWIYDNADEGGDIEENEEDDMPDMKAGITQKNLAYYAPRFEYLAEAYERKYNDLGDMLIAVGIQPSWSSSPFLGVAKVLDAELDSITLDLRPVYAGLPAEIRKDMLDEVNDLPCYRVVTLKMEEGDPDMGWVFTAPNKSMPSISVMLFD